MKVSKENLMSCQAVLTIEAEASELDKSLNEAYHHLVNEVSIPGFRKGKAPRAILMQHVGKKSLLGEAFEHLIPQLYKQAIESQELEPIARPEIEIIQNEPLVFKAKVPLKPEVKLGDYHNIKLKPAPVVKISRKEITAAIEEFRARQGTWTSVDRPVELGDLVTMDIEASVDGRLWLNHKAILYEVDKDSSSPVPGFASHLQGAEKNKEMTFSLSVPGDYPVREMRDKASVFKVIISEIKEKQLPELNDALARSAGCDNLAAVKKKLAADLRARTETNNRLELKQKALDALVEMSEVGYPPILEDEEIMGLLRDESQRLGFTELADYLKKSNKTEEELKQELRPVAKTRLIRSLVLEKLAEEEKIEINSSEVDNKVSEIANGTEDKEKATQFFSLPQVRQSIEQSLRTQKTIDRLLQIATGNSEVTTKEE